MAAPNKVVGPSPGINAPEDFAAVTPSDTVDLPFRTQAIWVGVAGDVACLAKDNATSVVFKAVPVGYFLVRTNRVMATGTTATNLVACTQIS